LAEDVTHVADPSWKTLVDASKDDLVKEIAITKKPLLANTQYDTI
jgi:hypothetical protein